MPSRRDNEAGSRRRPASHLVPPGAVARDPVNTLAGTLAGRGTKPGL